MLRAHLFLLVSREQSCTEKAVESKDSSMLFYMVCREEGSWYQKLGSAFQMRAQVPASRSPKRAHLIRHLVLDHSSLRATERPCAAAALAQSSAQKHTCWPGHGVLWHSSSPSSLPNWRTGLCLCKCSLTAPKEIAWCNQLQNLVF